MRIDAHHHFWKYDPIEYDWIDEGMSAIRRDFLPEHLAAEIKDAGIDGVVSVQARQTVAETAALLEFARENDFIKGVVGWVPLISPGVEKDLERVRRRCENCAGCGTCCKASRTISTCCARISTPASGRFGLSDSSTTS